MRLACWRWRPRHCELLLLRLPSMPHESSAIPLGGALAAIYYTEPVTTYDADIIFIASGKTLSAGIPAIYAHLQSKGWDVQREHLLIKDFPVQFLAASGLTEEAVARRSPSNTKACRQKFFRRNTLL